jgi:hypothetical protein
MSRLTVKCWTGIPTVVTTVNKSIKERLFMGCWNGTCGISQLPILAGEKVKAFLLIQSDYNKEIKGSGTSYPSEYFLPWFFPVSAEYNDYGSVENIVMDWNAKYMLKTFKGWLKTNEVKILDDDAEINSPDIEEFEKLEDVFACVERGALVIKDHHTIWDENSKSWIASENSYIKIGIFMVLETVFNDLIVECDRFIHTEDNEYYFKEDRKNKTKVIKFINEIRTNVGSEKTMDKSEGCLRDILIRAFIGDAPVPDKEYSFGHYKTLLYDPKKVSVEDFINKLEESKSISISMKYLRKMWIPQTGGGSQSEELSFNKVLTESMLNRIKIRQDEIEKQRIEYEN